MTSEQDIQEQCAVFADFLKANNLKRTQQRDTIVETFLRAKGHLSTEELHALVREKDKKAAFTTVSRTLKSLTECGLARETNLQDGRIRFEPIYKRPQHHHIICLTCHQTIEFHSPDLEKLHQEIVEAYGFTPLRHELQILGTCKGCKANQLKSTPKPEQKEFNSDLVFARDAMKIALEAERQSVRFYTRIAKRFANTSALSIVERIAKEEEEHLAELEAEWEAFCNKNPQVLAAPVFLHFDFPALANLFPLQEEIDKTLRTGLGEKQALELAMQMEQATFCFFRDYAKNFGDTRGRAVFVRFAETEKEHYETLKAHYDRLP